MSRQKIDISLRAKKLRAIEISRYMYDNGFASCVCFSCGTATRALKETGLNCISIAPDGDLLALRWWKQAEIRKAFPTMFDATSGHLPIELMVEIAKLFRVKFCDLFEQGNEYVIPTGSGETILCLKMAFPAIRFIAQWNNNDPSCELCEDAPLVSLVKALFEWEIIEKNGKTR